MLGLDAARAQGHGCPRPVRHGQQNRLVDSGSRYRLHLPARPACPLTVSEVEQSQLPGKKFEGQICGARSDDWSFVEARGGS